MDAGADGLMAAAYAVFLLGAAAALDLAARHTHRRSERYRTAGFAYHEHLDAWECPEGQHLHRAEVDQHSRLVRYRAKAHVCNACPAKGGCTDSDEGREVVRAMDPWPHSEAGRFHRGISIALVVLAALVSAVGIALGGSAAEALPPTATLLGALALLAALASEFRAAPGDFPGATVTRPR